MKNKKTVCFSLLSFLFAGVLVLFSVNAFSDSVSSSFIEEKQSLPQQITAVPIPDSVFFAGASVSLLDGDKRERFDRELTAFAYGHSTTMLVFKRANKYFPVIEPILKEMGIPDDFKYLAVIETYLDPRAVSPAKAAGMWQFLEGTAENYGLEINHEVDRRYDVEASTRAACRYLKDAYEQFGDWATAAASYNAGMNRIKEDKNKQQATSFFDMWLPEETMRYVYRMMAIKELMNHPQQYGFYLKKEDFLPSIREKTIEITKSVDWVALAAENNISYAQLRAANTWIRAASLSVKDKKYTVKIPYTDDFVYNKNNIIIHNERWIN